MKLAPSILAADLANLGAALAQCEAGGADLVHVDVMDGH
ncbi:MAG TPA: ribulose-phosphate 3-epimerase, partial [Thermoanaerobaculia bacterium]|nr:ribulose-phosphate 3-epimerase [Thermoanaerobaculia bacterium]